MLFTILLLQLGKRKRVRCYLATTEGLQTSTFLGGHEAVMLLWTCVSPAGQIQGTGRPGTWLRPHPSLSEQDKGDCSALRSARNSLYSHGCRVSWRMAQGGSRAAEEARICASQAHWPGGRRDHQPPPHQGISAPSKRALLPPSQQDAWPGHPSPAIGGTQ